MAVRFGVGGDPGLGCLYVDIVTEAHYDFITEISGAYNNSHSYGYFMGGLMNMAEIEKLSIEELLAILPQGGYNFRTKSGEWIHGAVEQTWDDDPRDIDREDVLIFLRRHLAFLKGERKPEQDGDDCVVIDDSVG
jgi:hypothetical protein